MTADGQPACTPAPSLALRDRYDDAVAQALVALLGRRRFIEAAAGGVATLLLAACGASQQQAAAPTAATIPTRAALAAASSAPTATAASAAAPTVVPAAAASPTAGVSAATMTATGKPLWLYVFNVGSQDVTILDAATDKVLATKPLGAAVRWLSNEQRYWDGSRIWTYDFPENKLQAIAIDPKAVAVVQRVDTGTAGPGHSLMLTPDLKTALLNSGGSDVINVIDVVKGEVTDKIETGKFP